MKAKLVKENLNEWFNIFNKKNKNQSEKNNDMNNDLSDDQIVMNIIKYIERLIDENNWEFLDIEKQPMKGIHKKYICTLTKNNEGYTIEVDTLNWINIENVELDVSENIINELINILEHEYERRRNVINKKNEDDYEIARKHKLANIKKQFNENLNELHSVYNDIMKDNYELFLLRHTEDGKYGYENIMGVVRARNIEEAWEYIKDTYGFRDSERGFYPLDEITKERYDSLLKKAKSEYNKIANVINADKRK